MVAVPGEHRGHHHLSHPASPNMAWNLKPRTGTTIVPQKPKKGHFFFANQEFARVKWWKNARLRKLYFYIIILVLTNTANGFDGSMMNGLQTLSFWRDYFGDPQGSTLGIFNASMSLGSLIGLAICPYMVDRWGRKFGVLVGCLIILLGTGLQAGAHNIGMFISGRLLLGLGMCITLSSAPLLVAELSHPQDRAVLCTFMGCTYHSGAFIAAWTTYGTLQINNDWSWRLPSLLQCVCTIIILSFLYWIPESPRWYIVKDQPEKALEILAYYHADGNRDDHFVQLEYTEIRTALLMDKEANRNSRWSDFYKTKGNRKRIGLITAIGIFSQWSGNGLVSYYLYKIMNSIGITEADTQLGINGGLKTFALICNFTFAFYVDIFGRRTIYMISTCGTFGAFIIWTILSARYEITEASGLGTGVVVMIFCYDFFYNFKSGLMSTYTTEILPYGIRAKGYVWLNFTVTAALFFNQYANSPAIDALAWKYYIFYCVFLAFEVFIIYFYLVETRYTPMEEINKYFDGEEADVAEITVAQVEKSGMEEGKATTVTEVEVVR
jgi:MFS family permease